MPLTRSDETELLTTIHEGQFEQPLWSTFLGRLRRRTNCDYAGLMLRRSDRPDDAFELFVRRRTPAIPGRRFFEEMYRSDPRLFDRLRPQRVYRLEEVLDSADPRHDVIHTTYLDPAGFQQMRLMRIIEPSGGLSGWLAIAREKGDFGAADGALLGSLAVHLSIALRGFATLQRERRQAGFAAEALHRLNVCWITLSAGGDVIDTDVTAERLLQRSPAMRRSPSGRLLLTDPTADRALAAALRGFTADPQARPRALRLSDAPPLDLLALPVDDAGIADAQAPVLIAYIRGNGHGWPARAEQLSDLFGLSPSEARLALALSRGGGIAEGAMEIGVTLETARNYSKRIYTKTGTRGQADLARAILTSVAALA